MEKTIKAHFSGIDISIHKIDLSHLSSVSSEGINWLEKAFKSTIYYRFQGDEYILVTRGSKWESPNPQAGKPERFIKIALAHKLLRQACAIGTSGEHFRKEKNDC